MEDITKLLKKMKKKHAQTEYKRIEGERLTEEHKKPEKVGLTDKQKYLRAIRSGWK